MNHCFMQYPAMEFFNTIVLNQKFVALAYAFIGALWRQKRSIEARISSADLVQRKGFGSALCGSMKSAMAACRASMCDGPRV